MVVSEVTFSASDSAQPTGDGRDALRHLPFLFLAGLGFVSIGCSAPWIGGSVAICALVGLLAHEHAYVQAGQSVPLA